MPSDAASLPALILQIAFWIAFAGVVFTTLAPLTRSYRWWIRGWDFPRIHIAVIAVVLALPAFAFGGAWLIGGGLILLACAIYQMVRIYPYTRFGRTEIPLTKGLRPEHQVSLVSANVLMENTDHDRLITLIKNEDPDVLFLMETDEAWDKALTEVVDSYPTVLRYPLSNHYGLIFATRLPAKSANVVFLADDTTPAVLADLVTPTGQFFFVGLHPRPPVPGCDTEERDAQIRKAAQIADRKTQPVIAMGDFNDVAWSRTSEKFKDYGGFRDPRVGRGMVPSFDARSWWMRFPIDQLYLTDGVSLASFERLAAFGSDHFPIKAVIAVDAR